MAAGTEISQPVSALDENQALDAPHRYSSGNGLPDNDDAQCVSEAEKGGREFVGRPPRPGLAPIRHCISVARSVCPSDSVESIGKGLTFSKPLVPDGMAFKPVVRSGGWSDIGLRSDMEDAHVCIDDLEVYLGSVLAMERPGAFYGVFDGHGGKVAAQFVKENMIKFIVKDGSFPSSIEEAMRHAFLQTDVAFAEACSADQSGTTAITVLVLGRAMIVANLGDCRAVLCKRGKAMEMSRDHKPGCVAERKRIEALGGFVDDGYLNGQLAVARALGDWHMKGVKGIGCPLSAEPELQQTILTEEDEFLIIGCDGLWDVFTSQNAVDFARRRLQQHNDPERCSRELVAEALRRDTRDNLTVVTVCFQEDPPPRLFSKFQIRRSISADGLRNLQELLDTGF